MRIMPGRRVVALAAGVSANLACALAFWLTRIIAGSPTFFSFWNRPAGARWALTALYVFVGARVILWYTRKLYTYATERGRGPIRLLPLAFGLAVFGSVLTWLVVTMLGETTFRTYRLIFAPESIDQTAIILPFVFFVQFLFSRSTIVWLLAAGLLWPLFALLPATRDRLLGFYRDEDEVVKPGSLSFTRVWNVLGYMVFILSLLFQS
jgi:hypothetical protein